MSTLLVSAFFDIGRGETAVAGMQRGVEKYYEYFECWARMKNDLIIFTEDKCVDRVKSIREQYGRGGQTRVVPVHDVYSLEREIYDGYCNVEQGTDWHRYRMYVQAMSNQAKYNYIMLIKYWCLEWVQKNVEGYDTICWIDFGFGHGGMVYDYTKQFDFYFEPETSIEKIHLFALSDPNRCNSIQTLLLQKDCIMGCILWGGWDAISRLYEMVKEAANALLMLDAMDDDQQLLLMAYKLHPDIFDVHISNWFLPLKEYGNKNLHVKEPAVIEKKESKIWSLARSVKKKIKKTYQREASPEGFAYRMKKMALESERK